MADKVYSFKPVEGIIPDPEELNEFYEWTNSSKEYVFNEFFKLNEEGRSYFESPVAIGSKNYDVIFNICQDVS